MESPAIDLPDLPRCLAELIEQIPTGRVTTYGTLADSLGSEAAARWVGHWMLHHDHTPDCPCHRVVRADGAVGHYVDGDTSVKATLLRGEGVSLDGDCVVAIHEERFSNFSTSRPLAKLGQAQEEVAAAVTLRGRRTMPNLVAGVDVSYSGDHGCGAYVLWDVSRKEQVWSTTVRRRVDFPYITGLLAYRELPILLALLQAAKAAGKTADVVIVDGSGILHPRRAGIACHLGVLTATPTIGVSKKLLSGRVDIKDMTPEESRPVLLEGRPRGVALRATSGSRRPIFISPGHRVSLPMAELIVRRQLLNHRLPEVQHQADRLSRRSAKQASVKH